MSGTPPEKFSSSFYGYNYLFNGLSPESSSLVRLLKNITIQTQNLLPRVSSGMLARFCSYLWISLTKDRNLSIISENWVGREIMAFWLIQAAI